MSTDQAALPEQVLRLLDGGKATIAPSSIDRDGMRVAAASASGRPVLIGCIDGRKSAGTLALPHFADFVALLEAALEAKQPVLLFLDTAGVRLQDAARGELGFRHAIYAACAFRARGGEAVSVVPGPMGCFGAGALLALCLGPVLMAADAKLAVAGPKALEAGAGKDVFDASNKAMVQALMGAAPRLNSGLATAILDAEPAVAIAQIADALGGNALELREIAAPWSPDGFHLLPDGQRVPMDDGVVFGRIALGGAEAEVAGVALGTVLTVERAAKIANLLDPASPIPLCLLCDAEQSLDPAEDARGLALAYASLARKVAACRLSGRRVVAYGETGGTGAAFMVLGMMAEAIALDRNAVCSAVPLNVAKAMLGDRHALASALARELFEIGGVELLTSGQPGEWSAVMRSLALTGGGKSPVFEAELKLARAIAWEVTALA